LLHLLLLVVSTSVIRVVAVHAEATVKVVLGATTVEVVVLETVAVAPAVVPVAVTVQVMVVRVAQVVVEDSPAAADALATNRFTLGSPQTFGFGGFSFCRLLLKVVFT
jgi:hypothetical protein